MKDYTEILAHYDIDEPHRAQGLWDHLINVAEKSGKLGERIGLGRSSELIGLLHDLGKVSKNFQLYIRGQYNGRVNHSSAGAILLEKIKKTVLQNYPVNNLLVENKLDERSWDLYKEILQYPILAHHGLYDIITRDFTYKTGERLTIDPIRDEDIGKREEAFLKLINENYKDIYELYYQGFKEFIPIYIKIQNMADEIPGNQANKNIALNFYYGSLVRLLISILKEADIYDSSNYYRGDKDKVYTEEELDRIWFDLEETINNQYKEFRDKENPSELDLIRTSLADDIYELSKEHGKGSYLMDMPVGSGKTYAGLRYALGNANKFKKKRILYTTAFLSVLEQNAATMKELLGERHILEHHSNIIREYEGNEDESDKRDYGLGEYLVESWEAPIILTSLVQLSNTLFKDRSSNIRRFSKLIDSVIIIDEIQSLPIKAIYNFNLMMNFLTNIMNVTMVHSTATPPHFHNKNVLEYPCYYGGGGGEAFINRPTRDERVFDRIEYHSLLGENFNSSFNTSQLVNHIKEEIKEENSALIVLNTKRAVKELYDGLKEDQELSKENIEIIYLTTNQCPRHRLEIIKNMKGKLKSIRKGEYKGKIICVSTKLVEAGVDIDFDIAYRSLAGIDNIIQVGGRCNREGEKRGRGKVYIFNYDEENLNYLPEIKEQKYASISALMASKKENPNNNLDMEEVSKHYFNKLYLNLENSKKLEYITKSKEYTILDLLSINRRNYKNYRNKHTDQINFYLKQNFKMAAKEFNLIDDDRISVIVQYKNEEKINNLYDQIESQNYDQLKRAIEELQPYTIAIRNVSEYENCISIELDGKILILSKEAYDEKIGLNRGELESLVF